MFGSAILEAAIGLVLVYLLLSLIASALQESAEAWLKIRASNLETGLRELLYDPDGSKLTKQIYEHPLIFGLFRGNYESGKERSNCTTTLPGYIPPANFAVALLDIVVRGPVPAKEGDAPASAPATNTLTFESLRAAVVHGSLLEAPVQRVLLLALDSAQGDLAKVKANVEAWFNSGMERVAGWYKRRMQFVLLMVGLVLAVGVNVDSLKVASDLYKNDSLRAGAVAQAAVVANSGKVPDLSAREAMTALGNLNLPIGWPDDPAKVYSLKSIVTDVIPRHLAGWLITAVAVSFGAPFWFDLLSKLSAVRSTVKPQEKGSKEASADGKRSKGTPGNWQFSSPVVQASPVSPAPASAQSFKPHEWAKGEDPQAGAL